MSSQFTGVYKASSKFVAQIGVSGKKTFLGYHQQEQQAAKARDKCVLNNETLYEAICCSCPSISQHSRASCKQGIPLSTSCKVSGLSKQQVCCGFAGFFLS